jgi:hypothetical protein
LIPWQTRITKERKTCEFALTPTTVCSTDCSALRAGAYLFWTRSLQTAFNADEIQTVLKEAVELTLGGSQAYREPFRMRRLHVRIPSWSHFVSKA